MEIICHESVHIATSFLRIFNKLNLSNQIDTDEEMLAYSVGLVSKQIVNKLYQLNYYN